MRRLTRLLALTLVCASTSGCFTVRVYSFPAPARECPESEDIDWVVDHFREDYIEAVGMPPTEIDARTERFIAASVYCQRAAKELQ